MYLPSGAGGCFRFADMIILNMTQHTATPEQIAAGVVDLVGKQRDKLIALLTFDALPTKAEVQQRAFAISGLAKQAHATHVMIGGAPYLMRPLEDDMAWRKISVLYAFSLREGIDEMLPDGTVKKTTMFRHAGFI